MPAETTQRVKLQPLGDRVAVERDEAEEKTSGGIVLPDNAKQKVNRGKVISVGNGKLRGNGERFPVQANPGDRVLFNSYAGEEFKLNGRDVLLVREDDILAVVKS